jgi:hypothetical protein
LSTGGSIVLTGAIEVADAGLWNSLDQGTSESLVELLPLAGLRPSFIARVHLASRLVFMGSRRRWFPSVARPVFGWLIRALLLVEGEEALLRLAKLLQRGLGPLLLLKREQRDVPSLWDQGRTR